jgi:hypothetical protein
MEPTTIHRFVDTHNQPAINLDPLSPLAPSWSPGVIRTNAHRDPDRDLVFFYTNTTFAFATYRYLSIPLGAHVLQIAAIDRARLIRLMSARVHPPPLPPNQLQLRVKKKKFYKG